MLFDFTLASPMFHILQATLGLFWPHEAAYSVLGRTTLTRSRSISIHPSNTLEQPGSVGHRKRKIGGHIPYNSREE